MRELKMGLSSHASRWLVTAILGPLVLAVIFLAPPLLFFLVVALAGALAWSEFFFMCFGRENRTLFAIGLAGVAMIMAGAVFFGGRGHAVALFLAVAAGCLYFLLNYARIPSIIDHVSRFCLGHVYVSLFLSFFIRLHALDSGSGWVFFTLLVTFVGDSAAFYAGRSFGRRPLYPVVSPKKTMEGLWGGTAAAAMAGAVAAWLMLPAFWYEGLAAGLLLGLWGAVGDLFESMLKRSVGIKDSGTILMGHGGLLDRIDAVLFNVPLVYLMALYKTGAFSG